MKQKTVGFTCSAFDLLHAGHIQMLREAREHCEYLIVGLQMDPSLDRTEKNPPIQTVVERYTQLKAVRYVDEIIPYNTEKDLEDILTSYHIDVRILGEEYRNKDFTGKDICRSRGIDLYFNKRDHRFSSSELRQRVFERENDNTRND
jgi:glycerol-3-phosphate cytidylyltransferase